MSIHHCNRPRLLPPTHGRMTMHFAPFIDSNRLVAQVAGQHKTSRIPASSLSPSLRGSCSINVRMTTQPGVCDPDLVTPIGGIDTSDDGLGISHLGGRQTVGETAESMSTIYRLPPSAPASLCRMRSIRARITQSVKGASLRKLPGLRASNGT